MVGRVWPWAGGPRAIISATRTTSRRSIETIGALEAQREVLGDAVVDTAVGPLWERRAALGGRLAGEQRKLVTVLFADLVDFTVLAGRLDAEDVRRVVNAYFVRWHEQIEANGGIVEKFIGDAVMAVFGLYQSRRGRPSLCHPRCAWHEGSARGAQRRARAGCRATRSRCGSGSIPARSW